jgi:hypothetical protein
LVDLVEYDDVSRNTVAPCAAESSFDSKQNLQKTGAPDKPSATAPHVQMPLKSRRLAVFPSFRL